MHRSLPNNATHRAVNLLVEASDRKIPDETKLGHSSQVEARAGTVGHIARNVRLSLLVIDVAEPYVVVEGVFSEFSSSLVRGLDASQTIEAGQNIVVKWHVGGAFWVDNFEVECEPKSACTSEDAHAGLRRAWSPDSSVSMCGQENPLQGAGCVREHGGKVHACQMLHEAQLEKETQLESPRYGCYGAKESWGVCQDGKFLCEGMPAAWEETWGGATAAAKEAQITHRHRAGHALSYLSTLKVLDAVPGLSVKVRVVVDSDWVREDRVEGKARGTPQAHWVQTRHNPAWQHSLPGSKVSGKSKWESSPFMLPVSPPSPQSQPTGRNGPSFSLPKRIIPAVAQEGGGQPQNQAEIPQNQAEIPQNHPEIAPKQPEIQKQHASGSGSAVPDPAVASVGAKLPPVGEQQAQLAAAIMAAGASGNASHVGGGTESVSGGLSVTGSGHIEAERLRRASMKVSWVMWVSPIALLLVGFGLLRFCRSPRKVRRASKTP